MQIPFVDLKSQFRHLQAEMMPEIAEVLASAGYILGPKVAAFETGFADMHQVAHCLGVNSGTAALHLAVWGLDLQPDSEVIVPVNTFFATTEAISIAGAVPVFVDVRADTSNIDPDLIEAAITPRTVGIVPVHLYGQPADMAPIMDLAKKHDLWVVEDAAQAHCAEYQGHRVGSFGQAAGFSFYPGKNLGAYGEAGATVTNDDDLCERMTKLRNHGSAQKHVHELHGHNYRMEGLQGAVLNVKLRHIEAWTDARIAAAARYNDLLADIEAVTTPTARADVRHVYHLYVIHCQRRDELAAFLNQAGIATGLHYPIPLHRQPAFATRELGPGSFPVAERLAETMLSLPMFPELTAEQQTYIADRIRTFFKGK